MNAETIMNPDAVPTEPTHRWADDGGVLTEERTPQPPAAVESVTSVETSFEAALNPVVREPLLSEETEQAFLSRWAEIQVGFVEDPAQSVRDADSLIDEIAAALLSSFQARKTDLAAGWQHDSPGTEELRLALRRYRAFVGVILPR